MIDVVVRHRSASGSLSSGCWEYDSDRRIVVLVVRVHPTAPIVGVDVPVCMRDTARNGAHIVRRLSADAWRIMPARYEAGPSGALSVVPFACVTAAGLSSVLLTHAPDDISAEMARA